MASISIVVDANKVFAIKLLEPEFKTHPKDVEYFALALRFDFPIWSNEKGFKKQTKVKVFSTSELISFLSEI